MSTTPAFEFDEAQVEAAAVVVAEITGEPRPGRFERTMARAILQAAADIDMPDRARRVPGPPVPPPAPPGRAVG